MLRFSGVFLRNSSYAVQELLHSRPAQSGAHARAYTVAGQKLQLAGAAHGRDGTQKAGLRV